MEHMVQTREREREEKKKTWSGEARGGQNENVKKKGGYLDLTSRTDALFNWANWASLLNMR